MKTIGFIGAGNMGGALVRAAAAAENDFKILVSDKMSEKTAALEKELGGKVKASNNAEIAAKCDMIFLGVKPNFVADTLSEIHATMLARENKPTLVSMAAGVQIERIAVLTDRAYPVIRIMPNIPASVGEGMILYDICRIVDGETEALFLDVMSKAGKLTRLPEALTDAGSALSGCGPAFVFMFIEALADGGVACGLPRDKATELTLQTIIGSAKMVETTGNHPGALKDAVCSPGGSTIEGVLALEGGAFRATVSDAVISAFEKTKKLGK